MLAVVPQKLRLKKVARITSAWQENTEDHKLILKASDRKDTITSTYILCYRKPDGHTKIK